MTFTTTNVRGPTIVHGDTESVVKLANNPMVSNMTKRIDIHPHYTRELVDSRTIAVISIPTF
jgi:hypothetical protein